MMASQPQTGSHDKTPAPPKASWTDIEDSILRDMVENHGELKWSVIAQHLHGRAGKQCRERWINHLRPGIKTKDEDKIIIEAHKCYGNRWQSKKKKSEQVPPGQFSILEEYIRSMYPDDALLATPSSSSMPPPNNLAYNGMLNPVVHASASDFVPTHAEMNFNAANSEVGSSNPGTNNLNIPLLLPDLNISDPKEYYMNYPMYVQVPHLQLATQDPQQDYSSLNLSPYADYFALLRSENGRYSVGASSNNPGENGYYREAGCGSASGSGVPARDTEDAVDLVSREFWMPSNDQVTLDLIRFK
ncbi:hypothetical protein EJB05_18388, partial [Eragrostis curvula]